jgi:hypothetical protein
MEPSFERPDAYWAVPEAERPERRLEWLMQRAHG